METIVLSGPNDRLSEARRLLAHAGLRVEESLDTVKSHNHGTVAKRDYDHGFDAAPGEGFITCYGEVNSRDDETEAWGRWAVIQPLGFTLRMHWSSGTEGKWDNPKSREQLTIPDPVGKLARIEAALRAAGIPIPEED